MNATQNINVAGAEQEFVTQLSFSSTVFVPGVPLTQGSHWEGK